MYAVSAARCYNTVRNGGSASLVWWSAKVEVEEFCLR
jgi:hypothetical protein